MVHSQLPSDVEPRRVGPATEVGGEQARSLARLDDQDDAQNRDEERGSARFVAYATTRRQGTGVVRSRDPWAPLDAWPRTATADDESTGTVSGSPEDDITFAEAAEILGVSKTTIRRWSMASPTKLPSAHQDEGGTWYVSGKDVDALLPSALRSPAGDAAEQLHPTRTDGTDSTDSAVVSDEETKVILAELITLQQQVDDLRCNLEKITEAMEEARVVVVGVDQRLSALESIVAGAPALESVGSDDAFGVRRDDVPEQPGSTAAGTDRPTVPEPVIELPASSPKRAVERPDEPGSGVPPFLEVERHRRAKAEELDRAAPRRRWWQRS